MTLIPYEIGLNTLFDMFFGVPQKKTPPSRHDQRLECFRTLMDIQEKIKHADNEKQESLGFYQKEYRNAYARCEGIIKP
jgi:hypothetical protein